MYKRDLGFRQQQWRTAGMYGTGMCCPCAPLSAVDDDKTRNMMGTALAVTLGLTFGYFIWGR